ncbi:hypothetical protein BDFG_04318 [Blastomyces dermatitidis ATCC 26199]|nr:hypothetical protein BDFG_04318 [Blastomyces dermatitidis ATCC 26199]
MPHRSVWVIFTTGWGLKRGWTIPSRATSPSRTTPIGGTKYDQRRERLRKRQVTLKTFTKDLPELKWKQAPWGGTKKHSPDTIPSVPTPARSTKKLKPG